MHLFLISLCAPFIPQESVESHARAGWTWNSRYLCGTWLFCQVEVLLRKLLGLGDLLVRFDAGARAVPERCPSEDLTVRHEPRTAVIGSTQPGPSGFGDLNQKLQLNATQDSR